MENHSKLKGCQVEHYTHLDGFDRAQEKQLKSRKHPHVENGEAREEVKWQQVYRILFPDSTETVSPCKTQIFGNPSSVGTDLVTDHSELSDSDEPSHSKKRKIDEFERLFKGATGPEELREVVKQDPNLRQHFAEVDINTFDFGPTYDSFKRFQNIYSGVSRVKPNARTTVKDASSVFIAEVQLSSPSVTSFEIAVPEQTKSPPVDLGHDPIPQAVENLGTEPSFDPFPDPWFDQLAEHFEAPFKPPNNINPSDTGFSSAWNPAIPCGPGFTVGGLFTQMGNTMPSLARNYQWQPMLNAHGVDFTNVRHFNHNIPSNVQRYGTYPSHRVQGSGFMHGSRPGPGYYQNPSSYGHTNLQNTTINHLSGYVPQYSFTHIPGIPQPTPQDYSSSQPDGSYQQNLPYRAKAESSSSSINSSSNHFNLHKPFNVHDPGPTYENVPALHPVQGISTAFNQTEKYQGEDGPNNTRPKSRPFAAGISPLNSTKPEPGKEVHSTDKGGTFVLRQKSKSGAFSPPMVVP
jgi:hypothetical protein